MKSYLTLSIAIALSLNPLAVAAAADPASLPAAVGKPADAAGVWKWTTRGRNGQPEETVIKLSLEKGVLAGTLTDRAGTHPLKDIVRQGNKLAFTIARDTPNGPVPLAYSLTLDQKNPKIAIERPDFTRAGKKAGKKRRIEVDAKHETDASSPKP